MTAHALVTQRPLELDWPARLPRGPSLGRCLLVAAALHLLLVWSVGTDGGSGRGSGTASGHGDSPLRVLLQDAVPSSPAAVALQAGPGTPRPTTGTGSAEAGSRRLAREASADPARQPSPAAPAGQAAQGAVLRGLDSGLPAAPSLADLQSPPTGRVAPAEPLRPPAVAPRERSQRPPLLSSSDRGAPSGVVPQAPAPGEVVAAPQPVAAPPDAAPARPAALIEAERPLLPRADEPTQGVVEATRKLPAESEVAPRAAVTTAPPTPAPVQEAAGQGDGAPPRATAQVEPPPALPDPDTSAPASAAPSSPVTAGRPPVATAPAPPTVPPPVPAPATLAVGTPPQAVAAPTPSPPPPAVPRVLPAAPGEAALPATGVPPSAAPQRAQTGSGTSGSMGRAGDDAALRGIVSIPAPPLPPASAPRPSLNLELPRAAGATPARPPPTGAALRLELPAQDPRSRLSRDIEKSGRADCRTAHADKGLFAAAALAADALRRDGCKW